MHSCVLFPKQEVNMHLNVPASKYLLLVSNILILLCGLGMIGVAVYAISVGSHIASFVSTGLPVGVLLLGILLSVVALMGLYGAIKELSWALQLVLPPHEVLRSLAHHHPHPSHSVQCSACQAT
jgi:hypothetical protein